MRRHRTERSWFCWLNLLIRASSAPETSRPKPSTISPLKLPPPPPQPAAPSNAAPASPAPPILRNDLRLILRPASTPGSTVLLAVTRTSLLARDPYHPAPRPRRKTVGAGQEAGPARLEDRLLGLQVEEVDLARVDHQAHLLALTRRALRRDAGDHEVAAGGPGRPS